MRTSNRYTKKSTNDDLIYSKKVWKFIKDSTSEYVDKNTDIAFIDCTREYTYNQAFTEWDRYARAFSGLNICQKNKSRVAVAGAITVEPVFCYFGLNMTGAEVSMFSYPDFLSTGNWKTMVEKEKITDLIISDIMVTPQLWKEIQNEKEKLGLRNVILMHSKMGGPCLGPAELIFNEVVYHKLKKTPGAVFLEDLLEKYKNAPIIYGTYSDDNIGIIAHTSGTTKGTRKPIVYNECDLVDAASIAAKSSKGANDGFKQNKIMAALDLSSFQTFNTISLFTFILGNTSVFTFFGFLHPKYINVIDYYKPESFFTSGFIIDKWLERDDLGNVDFSELELMNIGGSYISDANLEKYKVFFKNHGFKGSIMRGYGMSEVIGNAMCNFSDEDILGTPLIPNLIRIQDEKDKKFYKISDGPRTGILHMSGNAVCRNTLDGVKLFDYAVIDGINYICTNDLIKVDKNGTLVFCGRADKYFVNNEGKRFDSGLVELVLSKQPAIDICAIAPVLEKRIHDTVPVLYVVPVKKKSLESIREALVDVYVNKKTIDAENIPVQLMIVDDIPLNQNGKIDIFRITRERILGDAYNIIPVREKEKLIDIELEHVDKLSSIVAAVPEGMNNGSAFNLFEFLN